MGRGARRRAWLVAASIVTVSSVFGCSLLTDLRALSDGNPAATGPDAPSGETTPDGGASDSGADAQVSIGPYAPRFERRFEIANPGTTATLPAGYTACFRASVTDIVGPGFAGKLRSDAADLRVFSNDTELRRVVDPLPDNRLSICVRLANAIGPGASDKSYVLRYGDVDAIPPPAAESAVFDVFDAFDGAALAAGWRTSGAPVVGGGVLKLPKGTPSAVATVAATDAVPADASLELKVKVATPTSNGELQDDAGTRFFYWFGFQRQGDFNAIPPWSVFIERSKSTVSAEHHTTSGTCASGCDQPKLSQTADFRIYRIDRTGDGVVFLYDDGTAFQGAGTNGDLSIMIRNYLIESDVTVDWVRARRLIVPEPTPTIGPEVALAR